MWKLIAIQANQSITVDFVVIDYKSFAILKLKNTGLCIKHNSSHPQIKAESQHFNLKVIVSFRIQYAGVQSQTNEKCPTVLFWLHCIKAYTL